MHTMHIGWGSLPEIVAPHDVGQRREEPFPSFCPAPGTGAGAAMLPEGETLGVSLVEKILYWGIVGVSLTITSRVERNSPLLRVNYSPNDGG